MITTIVVKQTPIAKKRPRFVRRGNHVGTYNAQETEEGRFILEAKGQIKEKHRGAVLVYILALFARPKSHYGTGKNSTVLKPSAPRHCLVPQDVDNIAKMYLDCLNGLAWEDDRQVVHLLVEKQWTEGNPGIHIAIEDME